MKEETTYNQLISFGSLYKAYQSILKGKRYKPRYFDYQMGFAYNLACIEQELSSYTYQPDKPLIFTIFCKSGQKSREIHAASVRDTIVQKLLYDYLYTLFDPSFISDNYGCRKRKGTLRAANQCQNYIRQSPKGSFYLQLDIRKFYYNIDHAVLRQALSSKIHDQHILDLCMLFVGQGPNQFSYIPFAPNVGLDVGAMISQLYGLIYLNRLDHYAKRTLRIKRYIRYVDDIVIIGESKERCKELRQKLTEYINKVLKLQLSVSFIQPLSKGINFAGFRAKREYRLVRKFCVRNFNRRLKSKTASPASIQAMLAHARYSASYKYMCTQLLTYKPSLIYHLKGGAQLDLFKLKAVHSRTAGNNPRLSI